MMIIKSAKMNFYTNEFSNSRNNIKKTWQNINQLINRKRRKADFPGKILSFGHSFSTKESIANKFNHFFANIGKVTSDAIQCSNETARIEDYLHEGPETQFTFRQVTTSEVFNIMKSFKSKTSYGHDGLNPKFVELISSFISYPLTVLINESLNKAFSPPSLR